MNSCLIKLEVGSKVYDKENLEDKGTIKSITLAPNGMKDRSLVAILVVDFESGRRLSATSNRFCDVAEEKYEEFYPSVQAINLPK